MSDVSGPLHTWPNPEINEGKRKRLCMQESKYGNSRTPKTVGRMTQLDCEAYTLYSDWNLRDPTGLEMDMAGGLHKLHRPVPSDSGEKCWCFELLDTMI